MTRAGFRKLALRLPEAEERSHMAHPDFLLTPEQQEAFVEAEPAVFTPVKGGWGLKGATAVALRAAKTKGVGLALTLAWRNTAPGQLVKRAAQKPK